MTTKKWMEYRESKGYWTVYTKTSGGVKLSKRFESKTQALLYLNK